MIPYAPKITSVEAFSNINYQKLVTSIPPDLLPAFHSFAESAIEVERRYDHLSLKVAEYLWTEQQNMDDFEKRVAPFGDLYVFIVTFNGSEPDSTYSDDDEEETTIVSDRKLLSHYEIYELYNKSGKERIRDRKEGI